MIKYTWTLVLLAVSGVVAAAAFGSDTRHARHRVVFEVNVDGQEAWDAILNNVENVRAALGARAVEVEIVAHGKGLGLLVAAGNPVAARLESLAKSGVVLAACENTMKRKKVTRAELLPFATTVDSGVAEVVRKQEAGWSYIKAGA